MRVASGCVLAAGAAAVLAGCGGGGGTKTSAPVAPAAPVRLSGFGTFTPACDGGARAVRFSSSAPATVFVRHGARTAQVDPRRRVVVPVAGSVPVVLAQPTEARTLVAWGRLSLGKDCAPLLTGVQRAAQGHANVHAQIVLRCLPGCRRLAVDVRLPAPEDAVTLLIGSRGARLRAVTAARGSRWAGTIAPAGFGPGHPRAVTAQLQVREVGSTGTGTTRRVAVHAG
jgi:hypothetical protein